MKQIVKILTLLLAVSAVWIGLLQTSTIPESYTWLLPLYLIVSLGCYGLLMVGIDLMNFPTVLKRLFSYSRYNCTFQFSFKKYCLPMLLGLFINVNMLVSVPLEVEDYVARTLPKCQQDIVEAREFLKKKGVDVGSD